MWYVIVFGLGWLAARTFYAFYKSDWGSWGWSDHRWWIAYHKVCCKLCPRNCCCERYQKEKTKWES